MSVTDPLCCSYKPDWTSCSPSGFSHNLRSRWQMHFLFSGPEDRPQPRTWSFAQTAFHLASAGELEGGESQAKGIKEFLYFSSLCKAHHLHTQLSDACANVCARRWEAELPRITGEPLLMLLLLIRVTWIHTAVSQGLTTRSYLSSFIFSECYPHAFPPILRSGQGNPTGVNDSSLLRYWSVSPHPLRPSWSHQFLSQTTGKLRWCVLGSRIKMSASVKREFLSACILVHWFMLSKITAQMVFNMRNPSDLLGDMWGAQMNENRKYCLEK